MCRPLQLRAWLLCLCRVRAVHYCIEQPMNSLFFSNACVENALQMTMATRHCTHLGGSGADTLKPIHLWSTVPVLAMRLLLASKEDSHARRQKDGKRTRKLTHKSNSKACNHKWVNGSASLKAPGRNTIKNHTNINEKQTLHTI